MTIAQLCKACGLERPHRKRPRSARLRSECVDCNRSRAKRWRQENWVKAKLWNTWRGIIRRCHSSYHRRWNNAVSNPIPKWTDYGALGIKVCQRWRDEKKGFERFCRDVGDPPSREHTLDRVDNERYGYCPTNVRWATPEEQWSNRKNANWIEARDPVTGELTKRTIGGWSRIVGVHRSTIGKRLSRGWSPEQAIQPVRAQLLDVF